MWLLVCAVVTAAAAALCLAVCLRALLMSTCRQRLTVKVAGSCSARLNAVCATAGLVPRGSAAGLYRCCIGGGRWLI